MKTLLILRHAKSSWDDESQTDHERPLNRRGLEDAPRIGALIAEEGLLPDCILGSTAVRVRETIDLVTRNCGYRGEIDFRDELYLARPEAYLALLRELPGETTSAMVVGHNPGLEELLANLTGEEEHLPTGALAKVELDIEAWRQLDHGTSGKLIHLWRPKELEE